MSTRISSLEVEIGVIELKRLCHRILQEKLSLSREQAHILFDQFLFAELSGKRTHGLIRIPWVLKMRRISHSAPVRLRTVEPISRFRCSKSIGYLAANEIVQYLQKIPPQKAFHIAVAQDISPTGVLGYYARQLLKGNMVFIFGAASDLVRVASDKRKLFGTNPFSAGISYGRSRHFLMDTTTAQSSFGELLGATYGIKPFDQAKYRTADDRLPRIIDELFNEQGQFTGSILQRLEEHSDFRQYALMLLVQCLTTLISQQTIKRGDLVFIIIRKHFFGTKKVAEKMFAMIEGQLGSDFIPGMHSAGIYTANKRRKTITIPKKLWDELMYLGSS